MLFMESHVFMKYHNVWGLSLRMLWTCSMGRLSRFFLSWFSMIFMVLHDFHGTFLVHACHEISWLAFFSFDFRLCLFATSLFHHLYTNKSIQSLLSWCCAPNQHAESAFECEA